jgi:hypothetical protein
VGSDEFQEAVAQVTGPGQAYEMTEIVVGGQRYTGFRHAPPSLRELLGAARAHGDKDFLVYEDERWTFADVMAHVDALGRALVDDLELFVAGQPPVHTTVVDEATARRQGLFADGPRLVHGRGVGSG